MAHLIHQLNKAFENRIRLGIMSVLVVNDDVSYNRLKGLLEVTDGNLASHIRALEKLEYIEVSKSFLDRKPLTNYSVSKLGRLAFEQHINALENLISKQ